MAKSFKSLLEVMVPASAKVGSDIKNQWLEPASYDEKMVAAMKGEPENIYDQSEHEAQNFKAQDLVQKNRKLPLRQGGLSESEVESASGNTPASHDSVNDAYETEALDLLEEIMDLIEDLDEYDTCYWRGVAGSLKEARDSLLRAVNEQINEDIEFLDESFKHGNYKLHDGSTIKLSKDDAKALNVAVSGTKSAKEMIADVSKNQKEFTQFLTFARNLKEDYTGTMDSLLEDLSPEQLQQIIEEDMSEGVIWNSVAGGAKTGAKVGAQVGKVVGAAGGGAYGAAAGGAVGVGKAVSDAIKKRKEAKEAANNPFNESKDENNQKKSILGTSAPALDSDPNTDKKKPVAEEELQEISKETAAAYLKRAEHERPIVTDARKTLEHSSKTSPGKALDYYKRLEKNRKEGISRAVKTIYKDDK